MPSADNRALLNSVFPTAPAYTPPTVDDGGSGQAQELDSTGTFDLTSAGPEIARIITHSVLNPAQDDGYARGAAKSLQAGAKIEVVHTPDATRPYNQWDPSRKVLAIHIDLENSQVVQGRSTHDVARALEGIATMTLAAPEGLRPVALDPAVGERIRSRALQLVTNDPSIAGKRASNQLQAGSASVDIQLESKSAAAQETYWDDGSGTLHVSSHLRAFDVTEPGIEELAESLAATIRGQLSLPPERRQISIGDDTSSVLSPSRLSAASRLLETSEAGKAVLNATTGSDARFSSAADFELGSPQAESLYGSTGRPVLDEYLSPEAYGVEYLTADQTTVDMGRYLSSRVGDARTLVYAASLNEAGGDRLKAENIYQSKLQQTGLELTDEQILAEAFSLLEQTQHGRPIAQRLKRDKVPVNLTSGTGGISLLKSGKGGYYNPLTHDITIARRSDTTPEQLASMLGHEGQHHIDLQDRNLGMRAIDVVSTGVGNMFTAPFRLENPLVSGLESGWDKALDTERSAYGLQSKINTELGVANEHRSHDDIEQQLDQGVYSMPAAVRLGGGVGLGILSSLMLTSGAAVSAKYLGTPKLGWKPMAMGAVLTGALMGYQALRGSSSND